MTNCMHCGKEVPPLRASDTFPTCFVCEEPPPEVTVKILPYRSLHAFPSRCDLPEWQRVQQSRRFSQRGRRR